MSVYAFLGDPEKGGIPRHARVRIEAMPGRRVIFDEIVSKAVHIDLDPGMYVASVAKFWPAPEGEPQAGICYVTEFYHDISPEQFNALRVMQPKFCRGMMTSDGAKWFCKASGCGDSFTSQIAAVLHEHHDHLGIDLLKVANPLLASEEASQTAKRVSLVPEEQAPGLLGRFGATTRAEAEVAPKGPSGPLPISSAGPRPTRSAIIGLPAEAPK